MHGEINKVAVIIPVYKDELTESEKKSFLNTLSVLYNYPIIVIKPENLDFKKCLFFSEFNNNKNVEFKNFNKKYFSSVDGYNKLLLSTNFYNSFLKYKYILICQLDTYIFSDRLIEWVDKGYDYIGAPWLPEDAEKYLENIKKGKLKFWFDFMQFVNKNFFGKKDFAIGNGGLSLRNVRKALFILRYFKLFAKKNILNEDIFWSITTPLLCPFFRVPDLKGALGFSFEKNSSFFYEVNNKELPFGCHAWEKYDHVFWKKYIPI